MLRRTLLPVALLFVGCGAPSEPAGDAGAHDVLTINTEGGEDGSRGDDGDDRCTPSSCPEDEVCDAVSGRCVGCLTDNECAENASCDPDKNECVCDEGFHDCDRACLDDASPASCGTRCDPCPGDTNGTATCQGRVCGIECNAPLVFDPIRGECVECVADAACTDLAAPRCADGACAPCTADEDCARFPTAATCDGGTCVECTTADESACAPKSCDPATRTCTQTDVASVGRCEPCLSDSECDDGHGCVPMEFQMMSRNAAFCLPVAAGDCSAFGGFSRLVARASTSGVQTDYCTINEDLSTCEVRGDYAAPCADNSDCGATGLDDGICEPIDFDVAGCTYLCAATDECPGVSIIGCATGNLDGDKWCGAY